MMATLVAPMIGTWLVLIDGWRTIFAAVFVRCGLCLLMVSVGLKESLPAQARGTSLKKVEALDHFSHCSSSIDTNFSAAGESEAPRR